MQDTAVLIMYKKDYGIYKITNLINGKAYIGSSSFSIYQRLQCHKKRLRTGKHPNKHLQSAWNLYGEDLFSFEVLEIILDKQEVLSREQYYLDFFIKNNGIDSVYNTCKVTGTTLGIKKTSEQRELISKIVKEKMNSKEISNKISNRNRLMWKNQEYREKMLLNIKTQNRIRSKIYKGFISPLGEKYENIINLKNFAEDHNLTLTGLCQIISGKQSTHRGWSIL